MRYDFQQWTKQLQGRYEAYLLDENNKETLGTSSPINIIVQTDAYDSYDIKHLITKAEKFFYKNLEKKVLKEEVKRMEKEFKKYNSKFKPSRVKLVFHNVRDLEKGVVCGS